MDQPTANAMLAELEPFVGEWTLEVIGADGTPWPGHGPATFEWHDSRAHLIERSTVTPRRPTRSP